MKLLAVVSIGVVIGFWVALLYLSLDPFKDY